MTRPLQCPECGELAGVRIVWGLPGPDDMQRTDVVFGGCVLPPDPPDHRCQECGHSWGAR